MELLTKEMKQCIEACVVCERVCKETMMHCLHHGGKHANPQHIGLLNGCASLCRASAELMVTTPTFSKQQYALCVQICIACAEDCNKFDEEFMKECGKVCRDCAKVCEKMSAY